jgi:hypothetical protein
MRANVMILYVFAVICVGCDYGRSGYYRLSFDPARVGGSEASSSVSREQLVQSIRSTLKGRGYEEWVGKHIVWNKGGAHAEWETSASGDLTLRIWAFGGKAAFRDSQQIELELLRLVTFHPDVRVLRVEPPPRTLE